MFTYYVKTDKDGFITDAPALDAADGLTAVTCGATTKDYLLKYYTKYRVDNGNLVAPGNLPDMSIEALQNIINQQGSQLDTALATIKTLQAMAGTLTTQQTQLNTTLTKANDTIDGLQKMAGTLTLQATQLTKANATATTAPATNTATK